MFRTLENLDLKNLVCFSETCLRRLCSEDGMDHAKDTELTYTALTTALRTTNTSAG